MLWSLGFVSKAPPLSEETPPRALRVLTILIITTLHNKEFFFPNDVNDDVNDGKREKDFCDSLYTLESL